MYLNIQVSFSQNTLLIDSISWSSLVSWKPLVTLHPLHPAATGQMWVPSRTADRVTPALGWRGRVASAAAAGPEE